MTFLLLDADNNWRLDDARAQADVLPRLAVGQTLALATAGGGPLSFGSPDGSLGRLRLPRGLALGDEATPYLLVTPEIKGDKGDACILRFDRKRKLFTPLPGIGGRADDARGLLKPKAIVLSGRSLYVADAGRVCRFDTTTLALLEIIPLPGEMPLDLAAHGGQIYVLTTRRLYRLRSGARRPQLILDLDNPTSPNAPAPEGWQAVVVNRAGDLMLYDGGQALHCYDCHGTYLRSAADAGDVRGEFDPPALYADLHKPARFLVPQEMVDPCQPRRPAAPVTPESKAWADALRSPDSLFFQLVDGQTVRLETDLAVIDETPRPPMFLKDGAWISGLLDSRTHQCQWHTVEIELDALPRGCKVTLSSYSSSAEAGSFQVQPAQWDEAGLMTKDQSEKVTATALIRSRPGRYLRIRVRLSGDGRGSPQIRRIKIRYPRDSYLQYLPAEYLRNEPSRQFLEHYLAIIQQEWDAIEARTADFAAMADPRAVPEGDLLHYLAAWLGLPLEGLWSGEQKRRLLVAAPAIMARRGTMAGLRDYLQVYLENMSGLPPSQLEPYPIIIEGYRERERASLPSGDTLGIGMPLWSASVVRRLQLDVFATEGEVALVSTGDPERDLYHEYAHRFRVIVPAVWVRDEASERMLRRAIDAEKPAHTAYQLTLVPSRMIVGAQSTLGVDAILGSRPPLRLNRDALGESTLPGEGTTESDRLFPGVSLPGMRLG